MPVPRPPGRCMPIHIVGVRRLYAGISGTVGPGRAAGEACGLAQGHVTESAGRPPLGVTGFCPPPSPTSSRHRIYISAMVVRLRFLTDVSDVCECVVHF